MSKKNSHGRNDCHNYQNKRGKAKQLQNSKKIIKDKKLHENILTAILISKVHLNVDETKLISLKILESINNKKIIVTRTH